MSGIDGPGRPTVPKRPLVRPVEPVAPADGLKRERLNEPTKPEPKERPAEPRAEPLESPDPLAGISDKFPVGARVAIQSGPYAGRSGLVTGHGLADKVILYDRDMNLESVPVPVAWISLPQATRVPVPIDIHGRWVNTVKQS